MMGAMAIATLCLPYARTLASKIEHRDGNPFETIANKKPFNFFILSPDNNPVLRTYDVLSPTALLKHGYRMKIKQGK